MKKLKIFAFVVGAMLALTGCGSKIELPTAINNSTKINSFSYNFSLEGSSAALNDLTEGYGIESDKVEVGLEGRMKKKMVGLRIIQKSLQLMVVYP